MKRTYGAVAAVCILATGLLGTQANADLVKFLQQDQFGSYTLTEQDRKDQLRTSIRLTQSNTDYLPKLVKIGSHVLRERLMQAGCTEASGEFIKCIPSVLSRELERFERLRKFK